MQQYNPLHILEAGRNKHFVGDLLIIVPNTDIVLDTDKHLAKGLKYSGIYMGKEFTQSAKLKEDVWYIATRLGTAYFSSSGLSQIKIALAESNQRKLWQHKSQEYVELYNSTRQEIAEGIGVDKLPVDAFKTRLWNPYYVGGDEDREERTRIIQLYPGATGHN